MEVLTVEVVSVISGFVALTFFMLGRWSAFKTIDQRLRAAKLAYKNIPSQLVSVLIETASQGSDSDFQKYANSIRHREKYKKSKLSD